MEAATIQKYIHTSPRKLRLVADMVRQMKPGKALEILRITPKAASKDLAKALKTVLANAGKSGMDFAKINFKKIEINESAKMRRFKAGTRGRAKPFKRRMSHIKIVLTDQIVQKDSERLRKPEGQSRFNRDQKVRGSDTLTLPPRGETGRHSDTPVSSGSPGNSEFSKKKKEAK